MQNCDCSIIGWHDHITFISENVAIFLCIFFADSKVWILFPGQCYLAANVKVSYDNDEVLITETVCLKTYKLLRTNDLN